VAFSQKGEEFGVPFRVRLTFPGGEPAAGVPVDFAAQGIRLALSDDQVLTDADGFAEVSVTALDQGGWAFVSARVADVQKGVTYIVQVETPDGAALQEFSTVRIVDPVGNEDAASVPADGSRVRIEVQLKTSVDDIYPDHYVVVPQPADGSVQFTDPLFTFDGELRIATFEVWSDVPLGDVLIRVSTSPPDPLPGGVLDDFVTVTFTAP